MNNLFLAITIFLSTFSHVMGQQYADSQHGDWTFWTGEDYFFLYSSKGTLVDNVVEIPDLTIRVKKSDEGDIDVRLDNARVFVYDETGEKNFVYVDIIIDDGDIITYQGDIRALQNNDSKTRIYLKGYEDSPKFVDLFKDMKEGNEIFIRTTGTMTYVFKYSLSGFSEGFEKLHNAWSAHKNPFNKQHKNPFNNYTPQSQIRD